MAKFERIRIATELYFDYIAYPPHYTFLTKKPDVTKLPSTNNVAPY